MSIRTYEGDIVSVFLSEAGNTANISLDLGFRIWKVFNFEVGYGASSLRPGDKVIVDVEMRKKGRERTYRARDIRRDVQQTHPKPQTLVQRYLAVSALTLQERSTYE